MQIRKRGARFQLLKRSRNRDTGKYSHEVIGSFPANVRTADEIDRDLIDALTKRQQGQLEEYLARRQEKLETSLKKKTLETAPANIAELARAISNNFTENYNIEEMLQSYRLLTKALAEHGYGPELVVTTLTIAAKTIPEYELDEQLAADVMKAWDLVRKPLEEHGFSTRWYSTYKKLKRS